MASSRHPWREAYSQPLLRVEKPMWNGEREREPQGDVAATCFKHGLLLLVSTMSCSSNRRDGTWGIFKMVEHFGQSSSIHSQINNIRTLCSTSWPQFFSRWCLSTALHMVVQWTNVGLRRGQCLNLVSRKCPMQGACGEEDGCFFCLYPWMAPLDASERQKRSRLVSTKTEGQLAVIRLHTH